PRRRPARHVDPPGGGGGGTLRQGLELRRAVQPVGFAVRPASTERRPADADPVRGEHVTYELAIDLDAVRAIDMHVHVETDVLNHRALPTELTDAATRYFKA